ncbi:MAG: glutathione-disulfide reductase [Cyanophyceae cyanobacterium]
MSYQYDLFVIGAGPGGLAAAQSGAAQGIRVAVAEQEDIGGTCQNRGCIPKKLMVYAADFFLHEKLATSYSLSHCQRQIDWPQFMAKVHQHLDNLNETYTERLQEAGIEIIRGRATLVNAHTVQVGSSEFTVDKILIAVGSQPFVPDSITGKELAITSREMFHLPEIPKRLAVIGGGYIGVEFTSMMNAFGSQVTLMDTDELILSGFDNDIRSSVLKGLQGRGVQFLAETTAKEIKQEADGLTLSLSSDTQPLTVDQVLIATGRAPNTRGIGLEKAGVKVGEKGEIQVDEYSRTTQENIFAVGDCTNRVPLTPVAKAEGQAVIKAILGQPKTVDYEWVTSAVFARPEAATVGYTEAAAREQGRQIRCYYTDFQPLLYSLTDANEFTNAMMKLVVEGEQERVIGVHMVGEHAADIVQSLAVAVRKGITKQDFDNTFAIHPTTAEEFLTLD